MGRRHKHHSGSRSASDQIPGKNQNNICLRPCLSLWYQHQAFRDDTRKVLYSSVPANASDHAIRAMPCAELVGGGGRKRALRKERNGVQAIKIQRGVSANQEADLPERQRLIFNCHGEGPVKEGFDEVLTEDGIPLDSQRMPGYRFGHNR